MKGFKDYYTQLSDFLEDQLAIVQHTPKVLISITLVLIAREYHLFKRFYSVRDIPDRFIGQQRRLHGVLKQVDQEGKLLVKHKPIISLLPDSFPERYLSIRLLGINHNDRSIKYLNELLNQKPLYSVRIKPIDLTENKEDLLAVIYLRENFFKRTDLNLLLVKEGYAILADTTNKLAWPVNLTAIQRYVQKLIQSEKTAESKYKGLWEDSKPPSIFKRVWDYLTSWRKKN